MIVTDYVKLLCYEKKTSEHGKEKLTSLERYNKVIPRQGLL